VEDRERAFGSEREPQRVQERRLIADTQIARVNIDLIMSCSEQEFAYAPQC